MWPDPIPQGNCWTFPTVLSFTVLLFPFAGSIVAWRVRSIFCCVFQDKHEQQTKILYHSTFEYDEKKQVKMRLFWCLNEKNVYKIRKKVCV